MITVIDKEDYSDRRKITVIMDDCSDDVSANHRNHKESLLLGNHSNHYLRLRRAQSITEYTVFITVVVLALLAMQIYFKRGIQGKIRDMVSYIGDETEMYNPNLTYANVYANSIVISESSYEKGVSRQWVLLDQSNRTSEQITYPESAP